MFDGTSCFDCYSGACFRDMKGVVLLHGCDKGCVHGCYLATLVAG
jgi:hypothetical protein